MKEKQEDRPSYRYLFVVCERLAFQRDKLQAELDALKKERAELIEWLKQRRIIAKGTDVEGFVGTMVDAIFQFLGVKEA